MELRELRDKIDRVDEDLLRLFLERMELSEQIAQRKRELDLPILNAEREAEILAWVTEAAGDRAGYARRLFEALMELSRARQAELLSRPPQKVMGGRTQENTGGRAKP